MSPPGPTRSRRLSSTESAYWSEAENICSMRGFPILTHSRRTQCKDSRPNLAKSSGFFSVNLCALPATIKQHCKAGKCESSAHELQRKARRRSNDAFLARQGSISSAARSAAAMASGLPVRAKTWTAVSANLMTCSSPCATARAKASLAMSSRVFRPVGG